MSKKKYFFKKTLYKINKKNLENQRAWKMEKINIKKVLKKVKKSVDKEKKP